MVRWTWWDWSLSLGHHFLQCFDTVGWVIWPVKTVPVMTYNVFSGTLNPTHSLTHSGPTQTHTHWLDCSTRTTKVVSNRIRILTVTCYWVTAETSHAPLFFLRHWRYINHLLTCLLRAHVASVFGRHYETVIYQQTFMDKTTLKRCVWFRQNLKIV